MNLEDNWLYEDGQDEIVFSVDTHCQLLGAGLCGTESYITAELELTEASNGPLVTGFALLMIGKAWCIGSCTDCNGRHLDDLHGHTNSRSFGRLSYVTGIHQMAALFRTLL